MPNQPVNVMFAGWCAMHRGGDMNLFNPRNAGQRLARFFACRGLPGAQAQ